MVTMETVQIQHTMNCDSELVLTGLPYKKGQYIEVLLIPLPEAPTPKPRMTIRQFRESGLIGMWKDRDDIQDSADYARQLREEACKRRSFDHDIATQNDL